MSGQGSGSYSEGSSSSRSSSYSEGPPPVEESMDADYGSFHSAASDASDAIMENEPGVACIEKPC